MALKILGAPATSAACERSFSKFSNIQSAKKNKLTNERAAKLLFISENMKFLHSDSNCNYSQNMDKQGEKQIAVVSYDDSPITSTAAEAAKVTVVNRKVENTKDKAKSTEQRLEEDMFIDTDSSFMEEEEDIDIPYADTSDSSDSNASTASDEDRENEWEHSKPFCCTNTQGSLDRPFSCECEHIIQYMYNVYGDTK